MQSTKTKVDNDDAKEVKIDEYMTIYDYFNKSDCEGVSLVGARLLGPHGNRVNRNSAKLFYVTGGTLEMVVHGTPHSLHPGDALLVRPGEWHSMQGYNARMLIVCVPAFDPANEEIETA